MRQDALARRTEPDTEPTSVPSAEAPADYDALCAALGATARGRAFLDEHARRARRKDTALALQALSRLEEQLRKRDTASEGAARFHGELRALHSAVVSARTNFTRFEGMLAKRETVMALFDMLELRITEMLAETPGEAEPLAANENDLLAAAETQATLVCSPRGAHDGRAAAIARATPRPAGRTCGEGGSAQTDSEAGKPPPGAGSSSSCCPGAASLRADEREKPDGPRKRWRRPHCPGRNPSLRRFSRRHVLSRRRRSNRTSSR